MDHSLLDTTLIVLGIVLLVNFTFRYLHLPVILGYLVAGVIIGPHVVGWISDYNSITPLAEFGIVFLMFSIGLDFSLTKLLTLKNRVFILGGLQVVLSVLVTFTIGIFLQLSIAESILLGCLVAMSSTAVVVKMLSDQFEIHSSHGLNAIGILLFQDLAVIPILTVVGSLSPEHNQALHYSLGIAAIKGVLATIFIILAGRWLMRPIFHFIAKTKVVELFTLSVLFIAIGSAWLTYTLGMTLILGAFLSGIMLGETEFRHQIKSEIRPFKDVLLGLFFVSIGMIANPYIWYEAWQWILLLLVAIMLGKSLLIIILCRLFGSSAESATRTGLVLAQGGEFSFAIFALAYANDLLPKDHSQVVLAALLISFAFAPFIIRRNQWIGKKLFPEATKQSVDKVESQINEISHQLNKHVILCGYGRVGQHIGRFLKEAKVPYIAIDNDPEIIHNTALAGEPAVFGNVTEPDILKAAKLEKASAVVIAFDEVSEATAVLEQIKILNQNIPTLVRSRDEGEFELLHHYGATKIVTEIYEESLTLAHYIMELLNVSPQKIHQMLHQARRNDYQILSRVYPGSFFNEKDESPFLAKYLRPVYINHDSHAINKKIEKLHLPNIEIISVIRHKKHMEAEYIKIQEGDILILYGPPDGIDKAEELLTHPNN